MFFFKACPKCHGDIYIDRDQYGSFVECIHCGLLKDLALNEEFARKDPRPATNVAIVAEQQAAALAA